MNTENMSIYLRTGCTDMRKSINTLSVIVQESMKLNPFEFSLFVFCNRRKDIIKILYWDRNGFCLWQKKLEKDNFKWPNTEKEVLAIEGRELEWLLNGLDITKAHEKLIFSAVV